MTLRGWLPPLALLAIGWIVALQASPALGAPSPSPSAHTPSAPATAEPPAQPAATTSTVEPDLRVAIHVVAPFVMSNNGEFQGFSVDLLDQIARRAGFTYTLDPVDDITQQLDAVQSGRSDMAITAITVTSARSQTLDFSDPMYHSGLQVMILQSGGTSELVTLLGALRKLLPTLLVVVFLLVFVGHLVWIMESRENQEHFPQRYREGIVEGLWWASVTMTTVGYGDRTPRGAWGRLLGVLWMFVAILVIANVTATTSAALTVQSLKSSITGLADLTGKPVATESDSSSAAFLANRGIDVVTVSTINQAYTLLYARKVDAVVFDAPVLQYYAQTAGAGRVRVVGSLFDLQDYGIALPYDSPYRKAINVALLQTEEDGTYARIQESWFGPPS